MNERIFRRLQNYKKLSIEELYALREERFPREMFRVFASLILFIYWPVRLYLVSLPDVGFQTAITFGVWGMFQACIAASVLGLGAYLIGLLLSDGSLRRQGQIIRKKLRKLNE